MNAPDRRVRILVVDDEDHLAAGIRENLLAEGYAVDTVHNGVLGLQAARTQAYDLIVLDVAMPEIDGVELCRTLRRQNIETPVLFLTVRGAPEDRITGLQAGGDDYLVKPFHLQELLLRIAAILRRTRWYNDTAAKLRFGGNEVDFRTYRASAWDGSEHALTHKEAMILKLLAERADSVVGREDILEKVWGYEVFPSTRTIDNFIVRLRKRFERNPEGPAHLHTIRGVGYRFTREPETAGVMDRHRRVSP